MPRFRISLRGTSASAEVEGDDLRVIATEVATITKPPQPTPICRSSPISTNELREFAKRVADGVA